MSTTVEYDDIYEITKIVAILKRVTKDGQRINFRSA